MFGWKKMFSYFLAFQDMQEFHFHFSDRDSRITCFFFKKVFIGISGIVANRV